jgi:hypothetical protein
MTKVLIGVATAALWFVLAHAANAEQVCRQVCDAGTCVSKCVDRPDTTTVIREHEHYRDYDDDGPGVGVHVPGVGVEIGR